MSGWHTRYKVAGRYNLHSGYYREKHKTDSEELSGMASVNMAIILGNLGADPELRYTQTGKPFCSFSVATSEKWTDGQGTQHEKTEWHRIAVWGKQAENCKKYLSKGSSVFVEGRVSTRSWEDQQGQKHFMTEIIAESVKFMAQRSRGQGQEHDQSQF